MLQVNESRNVLLLDLSDVQTTKGVSSTVELIPIVGSINSSLGAVGT